ncbi:MAG: polysaccharide deacetylase family protein, partial [Actinobacteria bacterium]|nr:polysaccharide deacetylase family protein [Actinomycetota bacterium]
LCYHEIASSERLHLRGIGITHAAGQFECHLEHLAEVADLVSPLDAMSRLASGDETPMISLSFDDGYRGVANHARPLLDQIGISAIAAINSTFADAAETPLGDPDRVFWRSQLCWLRHKGKLPELASSLQMPVSDLRTATMDQYGPAVVKEISNLYAQTDTASAAMDRHQMHLNWDEVRSLRDAGWVVANHSANHFPLLEASGLGQLDAEHAQCEDRLAAELGASSTMWVAPFDRPAQRAPQAIEQMLASASGRHCVVVGDRVTQMADLDNRLIHRINAPVGGPEMLLGALVTAAARTTDRSNAMRP